MDLETTSEVSFFRKFGLSSQSFGANEERVSLPLYAVFFLLSMQSFYIS